MTKPSPFAFYPIARALHRVGQDLLAGCAAVELFRQVVAAGAAVLQTDVCSLWLREAQATGEQLRLQATQCDDPEYAADRYLALDNSLSGQVMNASCPGVFPDVLAESSFRDRELALRLGLVSMLSVPVAGPDGRAAGVLNFFTLAAQTFSREHAALAELLAQQVGLALGMQALSTNIAQLQNTLETRKLVERAKEILMQRRSLSGPAAYRWIQKRSMDSRRSMRAVAETIILSEDFGYYSSIPHALDLPSERLPK